MSVLVICDVAVDGAPSGLGGDRWCGLRHTAMEAVQVVADARLLVQRSGMGSTQRRDPVVDPSCWGRVLPAPLCRLLASFFLMKVEPPPEAEGIEAQLDHRERQWFKAWESWKRITVRHQRRARHPRYCRNPTNRRWCALPDCTKEATGRTIGGTGSFTGVQNTGRMFLIWRWTCSGG